MLHDFLALAEALAAGRVGVAHVDRLERAVNPRTPAAMEGAAADLVADAVRLDWDGFDRAVTYWSNMVDSDGAEPRHVRRRISMVKSFQGHWDLAGRLDPVNGSIIANELRRLERRLYRADVNKAKKELGRNPLPHELCRTPDQRRADAFVEMARRSSAAPEGLAGRGRR